MVVVGFDVDADQVGAGFCERLDVAVRLIEHEMHIEEELRRLAQRGDRARAEGEVRHEMPVHDVEVNPRQAQALDQAPRCRRGGRGSRRGWTAQGAAGAWGGGADFDDEAKLRLSSARIGWPAASPHVEHRMRHPVREGGREQRQGLVLGLQLAAVRERVLGHHQPRLVK